MKLFLLLCFIIFVGCDKSPEPCGDTVVTYDDTIQSIIESSCTGGDCHVGLNGGWAVLPDFSTYNNLLSYLESGLVETRINSRDSTLSMPPLFREDRQISDEDLTRLNNWICDGFPEN